MLKNIFSILKRLFTFAEEIPDIEKKIKRSKRKGHYRVRVHSLSYESIKYFRSKDYTVDLVLKEFESYYVIKW
jgi:hypothetical protein